MSVGRAGKISPSISFSTTSLGVGLSGTATITLTNPNAAASPNITPLYSGSVLVSRGALRGSCRANGPDSDASFQFNGSSVSAGNGRRVCGPLARRLYASGHPTTSATASGAFAVVPTVTGVSTNTGPVSHVATVLGMGFSATPGNNAVTFGVAGNATVTTLSATSLTVTAPVTGSGAKPMTVTVNGQASTTSAMFTFISR